jgi:hypothetical protein
MEEWLSWTGLGRIADIASLIAFPVSIYTLWKVSALKRQLVFFARLRGLASGIQQALEKVREMLERPGEPLQAAVVGEIKSCTVLIFRYESGFAKDAQAIIGDLRMLENQLTAFHTDPVEWRKVVDDMLIALGCLLVLAREQATSREIGGDSA